jgi:hypothetical protein
MALLKEARWAGSMAARWTKRRKEAEAGERGRGTKTWRTTFGVVCAFATMKWQMKSWLDLALHLFLANE